MFDEDELKVFNSILTDLQILEPNKPYKRHKLNYILTKLDNFIEQQALNHTAEVEPVLIFLDSVEEKLEGDNPEVLLVTDY
jgi:hypothetical protein